MARRTGHGIVRRVAPCRAIGVNQASRHILTHLVNVNVNVDVNVVVEVVVYGLSCTTTTTTTFTSTSTARSSVNTYALPGPVTGWSFATGFAQIFRVNV
jgi:hypothetical protein